MTMITLGGRPRELRFRHKALKTMEALMGKSLVTAMDGMSYADIEKVIYAGLLADAQRNGETLTVENIADWLDETEDYKGVMEAMTAAFEEAFGKAPEGKNAPGTAAE